MILEKTFNLKTFTHSDTADKLGIDNTQMTDEQLESLQKLHELLCHIQGRLSIKYAKPIQIQINSGFRSLELNKAVGGVAPTQARRGSQHLHGEAADTVAIGITIKEYFNLLKTLAKENVLKFGQVIDETKNGKRWVHISIPTKIHENEFMISPDGRNYTRAPL